MGKRTRHIFNLDMCSLEFFRQGSFEVFGGDARGCCHFAIECRLRLVCGGASNMFVLQNVCPEVCDIVIISVWISKRIGAGVIGKQCKPGLYLNFYLREAERGGRESGGRPKSSDINLQTVP